METNGGYERYIQALQSEQAQAALRNKQMPTPILAYCIEKGIIEVRDEALLFELEKSVGKRIKPAVEPTINLATATGQSKAASSRVSSTAGMPVVNPAAKYMTFQAPEKMPFERNLPAEAMFKETVNVVGEMFKDIRYHCQVFNRRIEFHARRDWCTPELFKALLMDSSYVDRLRAAMYPMMVSHCERTFTDGGKTYMVPYITIIDAPSMDDSETVVGEESCNMGCHKGTWTTTFYLNHKGGIGMMAGKVYKVFDFADFTSKDAIRQYMDRLKDEFEEDHKTVPRANRKRITDREWKPVEDFLKPYATGRKAIENPAELMEEFMRLEKRVLGCDTQDYFYNLKTGKTYRAIVRNNIKEIRRYGQDWFRVFDATRCVGGSESLVQRGLIAGEFERQSPGSVSRIRAVADESLRRLHRKMFSEDGRADLDGSEEYEKECPRF